MPKKPELPPFDDEEQLCPACSWVGVMSMAFHEAGCAGHAQCGNTPFAALQDPHMGRRCPRCSYTWAERKT